MLRRTPRAGAHANTAGSTVNRVIRGIMHAPGGLGKRFEGDSAAATGRSAGGRSAAGGSVCHAATCIVQAREDVELASKKIVPAT